MKKHLLIPISGILVLGVPDIPTMAQNLFVAGGSERTEITSNGTQRTFASGVNASAVAFNSAGDLFVTDIGNGSTYEGNGNIYEFTSDGAQSTFATGLTFLRDWPLTARAICLRRIVSGNIYEFTPGGARSTFASGLIDPWDWPLTARAICLWRMRQRQHL